MLLSAKAIVYGDDINTDLIIAGKYTKTLDIGALSSHCMEDLDPDFHQKCEGGAIVVAGKYFGCGSSREHAPIAIKESGVACVIAKSFARIHKQNLINNGIIPLVFANGDDISKLHTGDDLSFVHLPASIQSRTVMVHNDTTGEDITLHIELGDRQERLLLAGGLLESIKNSAR